MRALALGLLALVLAAAGIKAQSAPTRRATQVFRLGGPDAKEPYDFSETPRLVVDSAGVIYARLASEGAIIVFRPDGQFVRQIGRKGEGPGEFQFAHAHGFVGDTLWVTNWPTPRISLFRRDGSHLATRRTPFDVGPMRLSAPAGISGLLTGGRAYVLIDALVLTENPGRASVPALVGTREMRNVDTIAMLPHPRGLYVPAVGSWAFAPMPSSPLLAFGSTGTAIATAEWNRSKPQAVTIRVIAPNGEERVRRQLQLAAQPIPGSVRDSLLGVALGKARPQLEAARRKGAALGASNERLVEQGLDLPTHYPPVRSLVVGIDGTLWLERFGDGRAGDWLVLDRRGEPIFQLRLPASFELQQASATDVWGTERDELDVSYMVRFSLAPLTSR
jgi:hypothetical protein